MKRKITTKLQEWKEQTIGRQPLLIYGARQVGKTYEMREFGAICYKNTVYVNFETDERIGRYFDADIHADAIISILEKYSFPVGKVQMLTMYPMDFEEVLWAKGKQLLANMIREHYESNVPLDTVLSIHPVFLEDNNEDSAAVSSEKATKKLSKKKKEQYDIILKLLADAEWHKTAEIASKLGLKGIRAREIMRELCVIDKVVDNGKTKGKM